MMHLANVLAPLIARCLPVIDIIALLMNARGVKKEKVFLKSRFTKWNVRTKGKDLHPAPPPSV